MLACCLLPCSCITFDLPDCDHDIHERGGHGFVALDPPPRWGMSGGEFFFVGMVHAHGNGTIPVDLLIPHVPVQHRSRERFDTAGTCPIPFPGTCHGHFGLEMVPGSLLAGNEATDRRLLV